MKISALVLTALLAAASASALDGPTPPHSSHPAKGAHHAKARSFKGGAGQPAAQGLSRPMNRPSVPVKKSVKAKLAADSTPTPPPNYTSPGALIRTAGQQPHYEDAGGGGTASVQAGAIGTDGTARSLGGAGVGTGAPDKAPGGNPGKSGTGVTPNSGGASGTGAAPNSR